MVPVPQLLQVLVVQDIEGIVPGSTDSHISNPLSPQLPPATQSKCGSIPIRGLLTGAMQKQAVAVTTGGKMSQGQCFEIDRTLINFMTSITSTQSFSHQRMFLDSSPGNTFGYFSQSQVCTMCLKSAYRRTDMLRYSTGTAYILAAKTAVIPRDKSDPCPISSA